MFFQNWKGRCRTARCIALHLISRIPDLGSQRLAYMCRKFLNHFRATRGHVLEIKIEHSQSILMSSDNAFEVNGWLYVGRGDLWWSQGGSRKNCIYLEHHASSRKFSYFCIWLRSDSRLGIPKGMLNKDEWRQHMFVNSISPNLGRGSKRNHWRRS
jgi:hypothetical protein